MDAHEPGRPMVLISQSPRRAALLRAAGYDPLVRPSGAQEDATGPTPEAQAVAIARQKFEALAEDADLGPEASGLVRLAADTLVVHGGLSLGKPKDAEAAKATLRALSGARHAVVTGVVLGRGVVEAAFAVRTDVTFRTLTEGEIARYVATGEPMDKAGAYGIQGLGAALVAEIYGSYTNVVGLPLNETLAAIVQCQRRPAP